MFVSLFCRYNDYMYRTFCLFCLFVFLLERDIFMDIMCIVTFREMLRNIMPHFI